VDKSLLSRDPKELRRRLSPGSQQSETIFDVFKILEPVCREAYIEDRKVAAPVV
jgi:hypothetical protein